jgi:hypothetical protein
VTGHGWTFSISAEYGLETGIFNPDLIMGRAANPDPSSKGGKTR